MITITRVGSVPSGRRCQCRSSSAVMVWKRWPRHSSRPVWSARLAWWAVRHAMSIPSRRSTSVSFSGAGPTGATAQWEEAVPDIR